MAIKNFNGEYLRLIRQFHGMSQDELGQIIAASRQYIHQIEANMAQPSKELHSALSLALQVRPDFFTVNKLDTTHHDHCHFRKLKSTPISTIKQAIAHTTLFESLLDYIKEYLEFPAPNFPNLGGVSDIEEAAKECRKLWKLGLDTPIDNMARVLENAGAIILYYTSISPKLDAISIYKSQPIIIRSDVKKSSARARFDMAHECGHLVLHNGLESDNYKLEDEANRFASAFLMPKDSFIKEFSKSKKIDWKNLTRMKLRWKTSYHALIRRAFDLNLIDTILLRRAHVYLVKSGQRIHEDYDEDIPQEIPELINDAIKTLNNDLNITMTEIAEKINITPTILRKLVNASR
ncbi:MAG: Transcriptional regulator, family [Gammaproteobacteria bacterium]|jgi:Zn-dependent peptidase ImmA (M78 family)/DNA-binding XRE family transcriptional regulator|nr:Transcriptional regulator, family [Gammaproteobacteria bacterium]